MLRRRGGDRGRLETHAAFESIFKNLWADHADAISRHYSGTGALKTDFTRFGRRTLLGALRDGYNSAVRYYKNNITDGFRQDGVDLLLGNYRVGLLDQAGRVSPLRARRMRMRMVRPCCVVRAPVRPGGTRLTRAPSGAPRSCR